LRRTVRKPQTPNRNNRTRAAGFAIPSKRALRC
jgi:hypothetical protein